MDYVQDIADGKVWRRIAGLSKLQVHTSLNMDLQQAAFESIQSGMKELDDYFAKRKQPIPPGTVQASLIAVDPKNGHVLAMIGGRDYGCQPVQPHHPVETPTGKHFQALCLLAALETGRITVHAADRRLTVIDEPTQFTFENLVYEPRNYKDEYLGQVTMRQAITKSLNVATIKFAEKVGYHKIAELAHRLGLNEAIKPYPAMAIGASK